MSQDQRYRHNGPVGFAGLFLRGRGIAAGLLACGALVIHVALAWDAYQVDRFNGQATQATATVTRIITDQALVRYETPQGSFATRIRAGRLAEGDTVTVFYTPDSPAEIRRGLRRDMALTGWFQAVATGLGLAAIWCGWGQGMRAVRMVKARRFGVIEQVTVTRIEQGRLGNYASAPPGRLHWMRADGTFGVSLWNTFSHVDQWQPDETTDIYVWQTETVWMDDVGPRATARSLIPNVSRKGT